MNILYWIIFGAIVGWLASIVTHNNGRNGLIANIVVGLVGSVIGGWIATIFGGSSIQIFTLSGFIFSILGAVVLLVVVNAVRRK